MSIIEIVRKSVTVVESASNTVTTVAVAHPGLQGAPGASGTATTTIIAAAPLSGSKAVYVASDGLRYADNASLATCGGTIGITTGAVASGALATVQVQDIMTEPSWNWIVGQLVYVATSGALTQTPSASGVQLEIGLAKSATSILIRVQPAVVLI